MFDMAPDVLVGPVAGRTPRFEWRGLMLDSARTRFPVEVITRIISLASRYGFNRVHWHLTDDQGWRFEVPGYPRLTEIGAVLPRGRFDDYNQLFGDTRGRAIAEADERWTNGFYTDDEIATVVAHAESCGVQLVPELDLPGHMMAAILAYPELGRPAGLPLPGGSMREHMWWPARNDLLWPHETALEFLDAVLVRIAQLFPGDLVHVGGDECAYLQWESDPQMERILRELGVEDTSQLQAWFMERARQTLAAHGKRIVVWDEAADLVDPDEALVIAWDEERGMERAANTAARFVFADARTLYLNRVDPDGSDEQMGMVPGISVDTLLTAEWPETQLDRCIGIQACVWSEFVLDGDDLARMLFPRLLAVAERLWNDEIDVDHSRAAIAREYAALVSAGLLTFPAAPAQDPSTGISREEAH